MKAYLIAQNLWCVICMSPSKAASKDMESLNSKAMSLIILSCKDHIIQLLDLDALAAVAWKKLEQQCGNVGFSARHLAFQSLGPPSSHPVKVLITSMINFAHISEHFHI